MWSKELFLKCGGCDAVNSNADQSIEKKLKDKANNYRMETLITPKDVYYVYMWGGRTCHLSGYGTGAEALLKAQEDLRSKTDKGVINLKPVWHMDYEKLVEDYICTL
jgi:hypothetical protein